jgi:hypothetical protein
MMIDLPSEDQVNKTIKTSGWLLLVKLMDGDRIRWGTYDGSPELWFNEICDLPATFKSIEIFNTEHDRTIYVATRGRSIAKEILALASRDEEYRELLLSEQQKGD